jgi:hypothetical protein
VAGLILATVTYYATQWLLGTDMYWQAAGYWLIRAPVFGLALGVAGTLARRGGPVGLLAALTVPAGAALNMVLFPVRNGLPGESSAAGWAQGIVWAAAATGTAAAVVRFLRAPQPRGLATRCHGNSGLTTMMSTQPTSTGRER